MTGNSTPREIILAQAAIRPELRAPQTTCAVLDVGFEHTELQLLSGSGWVLARSLRPLPGTTWATDVLADRLHHRIRSRPDVALLARALTDGRMEGCEIDISDDVAFARHQFAAVIVSGYLRLTRNVAEAIDYCLLGGDGSALIADQMSKYVWRDDRGIVRPLAARGFLVAAERLQ